MLQNNFYENGKVLKKVYSDRIIFFVRTERVCDGNASGVIWFLTVHRAYYDVYK